MSHTRVVSGLVLAGAVVAGYAAGQGRPVAAQSFGAGRYQIVPDQAGNRAWRLDSHTGEVRLYTENGYAEVERRMFIPAVPRTQRR